MRGTAKGARARRLLLCLGIGALAPLGVGAWPVAVVVGAVLAAVLWIIGDMLGDP